ncbi:GPP34 family phosphoprotein [Micromonospora sp. WMMD1120]|uniref:GOLPH3/VPS74 family protein n=1 Tax=Micromonospora sp. WMMD1120 TaxID=3016106 RepID=UPI00241618DF|nr:GPP34 family phosphoprotein [Micromonospora sp. WMMD1120]MDG4810983.1 GPP34 family phosphoprotein [Micromonospora sp. WMMD1120]
MTTAPRADTPTLAEDLLLLFQPASGTIAGENTLFYVLGGAVLADLALGDHLTAEAKGRVGSVPGHPPSDGLLRSAWDYLAAKPRGVQTALAAIGPTLREPVLRRLIARGDIDQEPHKVLGLFRTTVLRDGRTERRPRLLADVRRVLVDGAEPPARVAALAALLSASGTLPQFHREIPWTSPVINRAKELERGDWGADAAGAAVTRTVTATVVNSAIGAITVLPRS